jgi:uncharacterized caspase-like protein
MANNWAIVVGINEYEFLPDAALKFAVADALAMRKFLCEEAGFDAEKVLLCGDGRNGTRKATKPNLRHVLLNQLDCAYEADNLWFFFSGHGWVGDDQQDYLMTIDGNPSDLKDTAISAHFVVDRLRAFKAKNIVLVLDMCRNENRDAGRKSVGVDGDSFRRLIEQRDDQEGIITLFSCSRGESSYELPEKQQGAFTHALLEGLREQTILQDLERYLERWVPELHRKAGRHDRKQIPRVISEPAWKYEAPILSNYLTKNDISKLKERAFDAENNRDFQKALQYWRYVNLGASNQEDRTQAMNKILDLSQGGTVNSSIRSDVLHQPFSPENIQQLAVVVRKENNQRDIPIPQQIHKRFGKINSTLQIVSETITSPQWLQSQPDFPWLIWGFLLLGYLPIGAIFGFSEQTTLVWIGTLIMIWTVVVFLIWSTAVNHSRNPSFLEGWPLHFFLGIYAMWVIGGTCAGVSVVSWFCPWIWISVWTIGLVGAKPSPAWIWFGISTTPIVGMLASSVKGIGIWWGLFHGFMVLTQFSAIAGVPVLFISKKSTRSTPLRTISIYGVAPSIGLLMGGYLGWWFHLSGFG